MRQILIIPMALTLLVGCDGFQNRMQFSELAEVNGGNKPSQLGRPLCEVDYVDYELDTHLLAFELTDKSNVGFGFNLNGLLRAFGFNLKTEKGEMTAGMKIRKSLIPTEDVAVVTGTGVSKKTEFNFDLDLLQLGASFGYYKQTPLHQLTEKTMRGTLNNLRSELSRIETPWTTRAVRLVPADEQVIVPAGSVAGIREGDQFAIYNVEYIWDGTPCESDLIVDRKRSIEPIAILVATQVVEHASVLTVVQRNSDEIIEYGARVEIQNLPLKNGEKSRALARSVRLQSFTSHKIIVGNGTEVDLLPYISTQTKTLLKEYGLYSRQ